MARIFISHSSRDSDAADRMKTWLASQGFENAFLDFDEDGGISPGADWEKTLYREVERSQAVVTIETPNWVASKWCFAEYTQARARQSFRSSVACGPGADWRKFKYDLFGSDPVLRARRPHQRPARQGGEGEAHILIPIDRAEELFGVANPGEAQR